MIPPTPPVSLVVKIWKLVRLDQGFSTVNVHLNHPGIYENADFDAAGLGLIWAPTFLTSSQVKLLLLAHRPQLG